MLFHTPQFLLFFGFLLLILSVVHQTSARKVVLLAASYFFYMCWNPAFILLILASTVIDYFVGQRMHEATAPTTRKRLLWCSLGANLGFLAYFKYASFFQENAYYLLKMMGYEPSWTSLNIILPVGISFYTFQTLSYSIDIYRNRLKPTRSPIDFALFVAFFPQLVAGPIVRASDFLHQLETHHKLSPTHDAVVLCLRGLAKKVLIADNLAPFSDAVFQDPQAWPSSVIWLATLCFSIQIYCDFSGYSDIAIGIAKILGFDLPLNFNRPYFATDPSDFWRRWHISLSSWLRDYLYIPLGGNRGSILATDRNLMLTMLLGGLWHGASWNFVLWGFLHGLILIIHRHYRRYFGSVGAGTALKSVLSWIAMQYAVLVTWITFRVTNTDSMLIALEKFILFDFDTRLANLGLGAMSIFSTIAVVAAFVVAHTIAWRINGFESLIAQFNRKTVAGFGLVVEQSFSYFGLSPKPHLSTSNFDTAIKTSRT